MNELRAAIHDFIAVCVYWGGAAVLWYLWYRWFMAAVEESPLVAETFLLQMVGMVVLTFVWRRVGACILNRYITCFTCRGRTDLLTGGASGRRGDKAMSDDAQPRTFEDWVRRRYMIG